MGTGGDKSAPGCGREKSPGKGERGFGEHQRTGRNGESRAASGSCTHHFPCCPLMPRLLVPGFSKTCATCRREEATKKSCPDDKPRRNAITR